MSAPLRAILGLDGSGFDREIAARKRTLNNFSGHLNTIGTGLTAGITAPLAGVAAGALAASTQLATGMANVATLIPGAGERVQELKSDVQALAIETGTSTTTITAGLYQTVSAFGDSADTADRLAIATKAAKAGVAEVGPTVSLLSAATKAYGDTSGAAVKQVADLSLATVRYGETDLPSLASNMGKVLPLGAALNVSQAELFATIATGTGPWGATAEVTTQVKAAFTSLLKPSGNLASVIESLGYANGAALVESEGFAGGLQLVKDKAAEQGLELADLFTSTEALQVAIGLTGNQADDFHTKLGDLSGASGTLEEAFAEQATGVNALGFQWEQTKQRGIVLAQRMGDALAPAASAVLDAVGPLIGKLEEGVTWFGKLDPKVQAVAIGAAAAAAAVGPLLLVAGKLVGAVSTLQGPLLLAGKTLGSIGPVAKIASVGVSILKGGLAVLTGPIGLATAAVVLLLSTTSEGRALLVSVGRLVGQVLVAAFGVFRSTLSGVISTAGFVFDALVGMIPDFVLDSIQWLADKAGAAADKLGDWNRANERVKETAVGIVGPVLDETVAVEGLGVKAGETTVDIDALITANENLPAPVDNAATSITRQKKAVEDAAQAFKKLVSEGEKWLSQQDDLAKGSGDNWRIQSVERQPSRDVARWHAGSRARYRRGLSRGATGGFCRSGRRCYCAAPSSSVEARHRTGSDTGVRRLRLTNGIRVLVCFCGIRRQYQRHASASA